MSDEQLAVTEDERDLLLFGVDDLYEPPDLPDPLFRMNALAQIASAYRELAVPDGSMGHTYHTKTVLPESENDGGSTVIATGPYGLRSHASDALSVMHMADLGFDNDFFDDFPDYNYQDIPSRYPSEPPSYRSESRSARCPSPGSAVNSCEQGRQLPRLTPDTDVSDFPSSLPVTPQLSDGFTQSGRRDSLALSVSTSRSEMSTPPSLGLKHDPQQQLLLQAERAGTSHTQRILAWPVVIPGHLSYTEWQDTLSLTGKTYDGVSAHREMEIHIADHNRIRCADALPFL